MCTWSWSPFHACGNLVNWGDVPTWVAGIFAALAAWFALRAFRLEQDRDVREGEANLRAQAERVVLLVEPSGAGPIVQVINNGERVVTTLRLFFRVEGEDRVGTENPIGNHSTRLTLGPGDAWTSERITTAAASIAAGTASIDPNRYSIAIGVRFTQSGRRWYREADGEPVWEDRPPDRRWWQLGRPRRAAKAVTR